MAHVVVTRNKDLDLIFGVKHPQTCYHDHIDFYCRSLINIDNTCNAITYYTGKDMTTVGITAAISNTLLWNAGAIAGIVGTIAERDLKPEVFETPDEQLAAGYTRCCGHECRQRRQDTYRTLAKNFITIINTTKPDNVNTQ